MAKDKKNKGKDKPPRRSKISGGRFMRGRKSAAAADEEKGEVIGRPENDSPPVGKKKEKGGRGKTSGVRNRLSLRKSGAGNTTSRGGRGSKNVQTRAPGTTSYDQNKSRIKKPRGRAKGKKPKKRREVVVKRGNQKRDPNKFYPGPVSYKYTSPVEEWVEYLGRKPVVNDYGNGARLMLDETDQ